MKKTGRMNKGRTSRETTGPGEESGASPTEREAKDIRKMAAQHLRERNGTERGNGTEKIGSVLGMRRDSDRRERDRKLSWREEFASRSSFVDACKNGFRLSHCVTR